MSATRRQSEAIDRHNAAVMGLVAERDLLLAQQGELIKALQSVSRVLTLEDHLHPDYGWAKYVKETIIPVLTKLGKS